MSTTTTTTTKSATGSRPGKAPLKVIGLGLGRTGTMSMLTATEQLGFGPCYHMKVIFEGGGKDAKYWAQIRQGVNVVDNLDRIFAKFHSVYDYPAAMYAQELYDAYPDAKFILTVRDPKKWKRSVMDTIYTIHGPLATLQWFIPVFWRMNNWLKHDVWESFHKGRLVEDGEKHFAAHVENVKRIIPAEKLLVYEVGKDGWDPLCEFLGVPVPNTPFPHVNDTKQMQDMIKGFSRMATMVQVAGACAIGGLSFLAYKALQT